MGGVDLADMLIELYRTDHKSKRWYMRIFYWIIDVCIVNGWLLYKRHCAQLSIKSRLSLLAFRMQIAQTLAHLKSNPLKRRSGMAAEVGIVPAKHLIHSPVTPRPTVDVRYDGMNHWPQYGEKKNRCKFCKFGYTFLYCAKCNMHLCLLPSRNCFKASHVK